MSSAPPYTVYDSEVTLTLHARLEESRAVTTPNPPTSAKGPREVAARFLAFTFRGNPRHGLDLTTVVVTGPPMRPAKSIETWVVRFEENPRAWDQRLSAMPQWLRDLAADLAHPMSLHVSALREYDGGTAEGKAP